MENRLTEHYNIFDADHERRKSQLMASLPQQCEEATDSVRVFKINRWARTALAAAAVFLIAMGVSLMSDDVVSVSPQAAWATAIDNAGQVDTVHLRATTGASSLEMWWRTPNDFRMTFSNGIDLAHNGRVRFNSNPKNNTFVKSRGGMVGFEMLILGELGQIFTGNHNLTAGSIKNSTLVQTKEVVYKGENCHELTFIKDAEKGSMMVCVVNRKKNFIYDMKMYNKSQPEKILYHIEVLEVDQMIPDSQFVLQPKSGQKVVDRM